MAVGFFRLVAHATQPTPGRVCRRRR